MQFSDRQLQISDRGLRVLRISILPLNSPEKGVPRILYFFGIQYLRQTKIEGGNCPPPARACHRASRQQIASSGACGRAPA